MSRTRTKERTCHDAHRDARCYETGALRVPRGGAGRRPDRAGGPAGDVGASAAPWLPEVEVTDGSAPVGEVASAIGPDGSFVVAWAERFNGAVRVATRAPGAAGFSSPVEVAPAGARLSHVVLVVDATGATTVAWEREGTTGSRVEAARRPPGASSFGAPATVAESSRGIVNIVGVGDAAGRVTLAWLAWVAGGLGQVQQVQSGTWEPISAGWSVPNPLTSAAGSPSWLRPGGRWRRSGDRGVGVAVVHLPVGGPDPDPATWQCRVRHGTDQLRGRGVVGT